MQGIIFEQIFNDLKLFFFKDERFHWLTHLNQISYMECMKNRNKNSVDPDEMPKKVASHQGLHCFLSYNL